MARAHAGPVRRPCAQESRLRQLRNGSRGMIGTDALAAAALVLHALSAVVWVGGMFFAHQVLRPAAAALDPRPRLLLWSRVLGRFFAWVIAAIVLLLASGYAMVIAVFGGFGKVGLHVNLMQGLGILMMLLFFHLYFAPWRRFRLAVGREDWAEGGRQLGQIRTIVTINLALGYRASAWRGKCCRSTRRRPASIEVLPSGEVQVALEPPSPRGRK